MPKRWWREYVQEAQEEQEERKAQTKVESVWERRKMEDRELFNELCVCDFFADPTGPGAAGRRAS
jgi:hypothetical protein